MIPISREATGANRSLAVLVVPAIASGILSWGLSSHSSLFALGLVLTLDSAHTLLTVPAVIYRNRVHHGLVALILIPVVLMFILNRVTDGVWSFLFYFTLFHHLRQWEGIAIHGGARKWPLRLSLILMAAFFHTELLDGVSIFNPSERLLSLDLSLVATFALLLVATDTILNKHKDHRSTFATWWPLAFQVICLSAWPKSIWAVVPLLLSHTIHYFIYVYSSGSTRSRALLGLYLIPAILAGDVMERFDLSPQSHPGFFTLLITPMIWHYWMDGWIWRKN